MPAKKPTPAEKDAKKVKCIDKPLAVLIKGHAKAAKALKALAEGTQNEKVAQSLLCKQIKEMGKMIKQMDNDCGSLYECPNGECVPDSSYC